MSVEVRRGLLWKRDRSAPEQEYQPAVNQPRGYGVANWYMSNL